MSNLLNYFAIFPKWTASLWILLTLNLVGCGTPPALDSTLADDTGYTRRRTSAAEGQDIAIGAFNLLRLGHGEKNFARLAAVINKAKYDIFAATEIMTPEGAQDLLQALNEETGQNWQMTLSDQASGEGAYKEYFGFYYRADVVDESLPERAFCRSTQGVQRVKSSCFAKDNGDDAPHFERDPFVGHFKVHGVPVAMVGVHLIYGDSIARRQDETLALRDVMDKVREKTPGAHVFVLGDFNLTVVTDDDAPEPAFPRYNSEAMPEEVFTRGPEVDGIFDGPTTVGGSSYDHILYYEDLEGSLAPRSAKVVHDINTRDEAERAAFKAEVSDHYAITARFRFP